MALLEAEALTVTFGGLNANDHVDLAVDEGILVGLIGPNGAGKTTFIDAITGFVTPSAGRVRFQGEDITRLPAHARAHLGLARTWQSLELFEDLTVADNLRVAIERPRWWSFLGDIVRPKRSLPLDERVEWALEQAGLGGLAASYPSELSHGQRKLVGVARALACSPKLVLLDEPAAGLDTGESLALGDHLRGLLDVGMTVFLIDHDMALMLSVCDELYVLDFGRIIAHGPPAEIRTNPAVMAAYLGEKAAEAQARGGDAIGALSDDIALHLLARVAGDGVPATDPVENGGPYRGH